MRVLRGASILVFAAVFGLSGCSREPPGGEEKAEKVIITTPLIEKDDVRPAMGVRATANGHGWNLLRLKLRNRGLNFKGVLEVRGIYNEPTSAAEIRDATLYEMKLEVPGRDGAWREVAMPLHAIGWHAVEVRFVQMTPRYESVIVHRFAEDPEYQLAPQFLSLLAIGDSLPDLKPLSRWWAKARRSGSLESQVAVVKARDHELPAHPAGYGAFNAVLVFGTSFSRAPAGVLEALARWVEAGGTLVLFPGPEWAGGIPQKLNELQGADPAPPGTVLPEAAVASAGELARKGFRRPLRPRAGTEELEGGLACRAPHGAGSVTTFAVGMASQGLVAEREARGVYAILEAAIGRGLAFAGTANAALGKVEDLAVAELSAMSVFHVPERSAVVAGLALYLTLGFFLPAALFRLIRRPAWTFIWVVAAALAFTLAIYRYGLFFALSGTELSEVTVLRLHPDGKAAEATTFVGLMAPHSRRVDFWSGLRDGEGPEHPLQTALAWPIGLKKADPNDWLTEMLAEDLRFDVDRAGRVKLRPVLLRPNLLRCFRFDYRTAVDARLWETAIAEAPAATERFPAAIEEALGRDGERRLATRWSRRGVFPAVPGAPSRRALTVILREEPASSPARR